jgi:hypothetical protein
VLDAGRMYWSTGSQLLTAGSVGSSCAGVGEAGDVQDESTKVSNVFGSAPAPCRTAGRTSSRSGAGPAGCRASKETSSAVDGSWSRRDHDAAGGKDDGIGQPQ